MRLIVEVELDAARDGQIKRDVVTAGGGMQSVVHVPSAIEGGFVIPISSGKVEGPLPHVVVRIVSQKSIAARRVPIAPASKFGLQVTGDGDGSLSEEAVGWEN